MPRFAPYRFSAPKPVEPAPSRVWARLKWVYDNVKIPVIVIALACFVVAGAHKMMLDDEAEARKKSECRAKGGTWFNMEHQPSQCLKIEQIPVE